MHQPSVGDRIVKARDRRQWKQSMLCRKTGIPASRLSRLESGSRYPTEDEWRRLADVLDLGPYRRPPDEPSPSAGWKAIPPLLNQIQEKSLASRYYAARRTLKTYLEGVIARVKDREDADVAERFLQRCGLDSSLEYWFWLCLLAFGARPRWFAPLKAGYRKHSIVDRKTNSVAGDLRHPCLEVEIPSGKLLLFSQVTIETRRGQFRLDALVCVRTPRHRFWVNFEIDGGGHGRGHDPAYDHERQQALGLDTIRFTTADLKTGDLLALIELRIAPLLERTPSDNSRELSASADNLATPSDNSRELPASADKLAHIARQQPRVASQR
jgi:transcriptional regulator with XRE-family HTH domain